MLRKRSDFYCRENMSRRKLAIPLQLISGVNLDTFVGELFSLLPDEEVRDKVYWNADELSRQLQEVAFGDLFYLDSPVDAITSRGYLATQDGNLKLYDLVNKGNDYFLVCKPDDLRQI